MAQFVYSDEGNFEFLKAANIKTIFLAGPSPRGDKDPDLNWRDELINSPLMEAFNDCVFFIPLPKSGVITDYDNQIDWELTHLQIADFILFWIPRDLEKLPGFTTNVEFGMFVEKGNVIYGRPDSAPKNRYLDYLYQRKNNKPIYKTLYETIGATLERVMSSRFES